MTPPAIPRATRPSQSDGTTAKPGRRGRRVVAPPARKVAEDHSSPLRPLLDSWALALRSANRSDGTIVSYMLTGNRFCDYLQHHSMPDTADGTGPTEIRSFLDACLNGCWTDTKREAPCGCGIVARSPGNAHKHWRNLRAFYYWLIADGERTKDHPMANVKEPTVPDIPTEVFSDDELRALLKVCSGTAFHDRRDTAIMRVFLDTGLRLDGVGGLRYSADPDKSDVLLKQKVLRVRLKGGDNILVPIGDKTVAALDRYIRTRVRHAGAESEWLWLGLKGRLKNSGIQQMLDRRGKQAGVSAVHAHRFRHTMADDWLEAGGTETGLMRIAGWKSREMVARYGRAAADRRARSEHARLSPGDRI